MKLSDAALADLCARSLWAAERGYELALAEEYVSVLASEVGSDAPPAGVKAGSAAHVAALAADAHAIRLGKKKPTPKAPKPELAKLPEPKKEEPKLPEPPPPAEEPKTVIAVEEAKVEEKPAAPAPEPAKKASAPAAKKKGN